MNARKKPFLPTLDHACPRLCPRIKPLKIKLPTLPTHHSRAYTYEHAQRLKRALARAYAGSSVGSVGSVGNVVLHRIFLIVMRGLKRGQAWAARFTAPADQEPAHG